METAYEKVLDVLFGVAKRQISYMWNYAENVEALNLALRDLKNTRKNVQEQIELAISRGDKLLAGVDDWVKDVDEEIFKAEKFVEKEANAKKTCFKVAMCGNWNTLYRYGRRATKMAPSLSKQEVKGKPYQSCVSIETPAPGPLDVYQSKNLDGLPTHISVLGDIIKSLEDESVQIVGIYGLGGVGKTTLAMEVAARVEKNLFAGVAITTVKEKVNVMEIQKDIEIATKRIMNGDKILIILDDMWEKVDLEKQLGIPCGKNYMNCKILLTSRDERVCRDMKAQSIIWVNSLQPKEAWILFKRAVGETIETDAKLKSVAEDVVEECGGLPLLIEAVGNALKDESIESWKRALSQLQKPVASKMDPYIKKAFNHLQLSYDYLKSEEAKSCFLLCSMFPEDYDILLEDLVYYGVGLEKFDDLDSIEDARDRVENAVKILTSSGLLLNNKRKGRTRMHDVVRDVALLIAPKGNNKLMVKVGQDLTDQWRPRVSDLKGYKGIALYGIIKLPDYKVNAPHLETLLVLFNDDLLMISDEFIGSMKKLKVLDISYNNISSLPRSFQLLKKLRMLNLSKNKSLCEISVLGVLRDLEILILNETGITEIPKEISELVNLRVLEVKECENLSRVTEGVILALSRLEELCIDLSRMSEGVDDCIAEVMLLSTLTYLDMKVESFDLIPKGFNSAILKGFVIEVGNYYRRHIELKRSDRYVLISRQHLGIPLLKWLEKVIEASRPFIYLKDIKNLYTIIPHLYDHGFNKLEHIELANCPNVSYLVYDKRSKEDDIEKGNIDEKFFENLKTLRLKNLNEMAALWRCSKEYISFANLVSLIIDGCNWLGRVFTVYEAQGLVNLKELYIRNCDKLREVISGDTDAYHSLDIVFLSLAIIRLDSLYGLQSFLRAENCNVEYPSLMKVEIENCERMETWGSGIHKTPKLKTIVKNRDVPIVIDGPFALNEVVEKSWRKCQVDDGDDDSTF